MVQNSRYGREACDDPSTGAEARITVKPLFALAQILQYSPLLGGTLDLAQQLPTYYV